MFRAERFLCKASSRTVLNLFEAFQSNRCKVYNLEICLPAKNTPTIMSMDTCCKNIITEIMLKLNVFAK